MNAIKDYLNFQLCSLCCLGMKASPSMIGASSSNSWHIPVDPSGDSFEPMRRYFADPLNVGTDMPAFITFPSCKDKKWESEHPGRVSCQMLFMADYSWFETFSGDVRHPNKAGSLPAAVKDYAELKEEWKQKCLAVFFKYFPKVSYYSS